MAAIQLSDHFTYKKLMRFSLPTILMMVFSSVYGVVDGYFVSNFGGKAPFAAVNFIYPYIMILAGFGFMIGTGGCALIGKTLGEDKPKQANQYFSMLLYVTLAVGLALAALCFFTVRPVAAVLGADAEMLDYCTLYGKISAAGILFLMLQFEFQSFFVLAEKPQLGLYFTLGAGIMNMFLDWLLVGVCGQGIAGAAIATVASQVVGGGFPIVYFARKNSSLLRMGKPYFSLRPLLKTLGNGSSEFVSNISMSVVGMLYNVQLMKYAGENGVAAYGVLMYVNFVFISMFIGYSVGVAPVISFHFGAGNTRELRSLLRKSLRVIAVMALLMLLAGEGLAGPLSKLFVGYDSELLEMTVRAFVIFSFSFPAAALPIFGSSFFTALNDGMTSAVISFLRTAVFQVAAVLLLPLWLGIDGIWYSVIAAELIAACLTVFFWIKKQPQYGY